MYLLAIIVLTHIKYVSFLINILINKIQEAITNGIKCALSIFLINK